MPLLFPKTNEPNSLAYVWVSTVHLHIVQSYPCRVEPCIPLLAREIVSSCLERIDVPPLYRFEDYRHFLRLYATAAYWVASKYLQDDVVWDVPAFVTQLDTAITRDMLLTAERKVLASIDWRIPLGHPMMPLQLRC